MYNTNKSEAEINMENIENLIRPYENAIHDIKGPVTIIYTYVQMLESNKNVPSDALKQIIAIKRNCFKALKLINDLNDSTKLYNGYLVPAFTNTNIVDLVRSLTEAAVPFTFNKQINLSFSSDCKQKFMATDRSLLERVLLNLLSNSIKFTKTGGKITVYLEDRFDKILLIIKDNGAGIKESNLDNIFNRYQTSDNSRGRGIGLSIVSEIVRLLQGEIEVTSVEGAGTAMIISLPVFLIEEDPAILKFSDDFYLDNMVQIELADEFF